MAELFVMNGICGGTVFTLPAGPVLVGRSPACEVQLGDPWVSSQHARIERRQDGLWVVDLGSSNGTWIEDQRIREAPLAPGTQVRFGKTATELREPVTPTVTPDILKQQGTILRSLSDLTEGGGGVVAPRRDTLSGRSDAEALTIARRQVAVLNDIGKALVDAVDIDACLTKILRAVARAVRAERASLLLMDERGDLVPRVTEPFESPPPLSATLMRAAAEHRVGILTLDAQQDLRFAQSRSVIAQGIRSCLCVPVWADNRILGMMVLDRGFADAFGAEDLDLVTLVGYQAALAIERARFLDSAQRSDSQRRKLLRHFSPDVANMIISQEQLEGDPLETSVRDDVTVLFSDVKGFTGLTERLEPSALAALLKEYFRAMTDALFAHGGTLDKFIGDGLMAVFGAPVPQPDGAVRAVRSAYEMLHRLRELNTRLAADRRIEIRIGVNTGRVIAGNFGSPDRLEFTVLGDTVNTASRLESIAEAGTVFVGRATFDATQGAFEYRHLGPRQVRGKAQPVDVFQLVGPWAPPA
jgi:adenylate cyclase